MYIAVCWCPWSPEVLDSLRASVKGSCESEQTEFSFGTSVSVPWSLENTSIYCFSTVLFFFP